MSSFLLHYTNHPALEVTVHGGHFATRTCHKSHYVDVTPIKHDHLLAREAAMAGSWTPRPGLPKVPMASSTACITHSGFCSVVAALSK